MTKYDVQKRLFEEFNELNDFSGKAFITESNVAYPNTDFKKPDDNRYFELNVMAEETAIISQGDFGQLEIDGVFQIDIVTPIGTGEAEAGTKADWITMLFHVGRDLDILDKDGNWKGYVDIGSSSTATSGAEGYQYRTVLRINFTAYIES